MNKNYLLSIISIVLLQFSLSAQDVTDKSVFKLNDSTTLKLPDVFVKAERPILKVVGGKLQYNIPNLI